MSGERVVVVEERIVRIGCEKLEKPGMGDCQLIYRPI